ncbi:GSCOCG00000893001-RA-CDS [Cotesia congregata]|uniref:Proteasome subunit alpha type n=1 Tax=Cotesia congregata TaxID=51543 RepID=A0A8J2MJK7_COTCN|nr:GSCOCG00000893001-RA-CDS [Cotesia congregata]CAG5095718.1 Similar to Psma3: Proteasome subunit alpha type-3 (Mus musculus) [Cotesia congregata]
MSSIGTGYDLSASQFSPDGRVFQVEYAQKAVENSGTVISLRGKDGVVFAVEKLVTSKLYEAGANKRIFNIDEHIGMAVAGLISDARQIVETARSEAASYRAQYGVGIPVKYLNERVAMYMHAYTLYSAVRPYGCSVILSAREADGPTMYMIDPSGVSYGYFGCAVGKAKQSAKTEIEKLKLADMSCKELVKEAARIIYLVHDELKDKQFELEMSWVGAHTKGKHERIPHEIKAEAEAKARQAMAEDSDSDTEDM